MRIRTAVVLACAAVAASVSVPALRHPSGPGAAVAGEGRREKVRRLAERLGYPEWLRDIVKREFAEKYKDDPKALQEALGQVKWSVLLDFVVEELDQRVDDATLDEVLPYLDTPEGKKHLALVRLERSRAALDLVLLLGGGRSKVMDETDKRFSAAFREATGMVSSDPRTAASCETAAIATLRNLASCEAQIQCSGKIDCDEDGIGEYGTFLEMTGSVGVRRFFSAATPGGACDFSLKGRPLNPPILSPALATVDADGIVVKAGYCFRIYLPDTGDPSGFAHEAGPAASVAVAGGPILVDLAETSWCAYAWPAERGVSGERAFFINQSGDVMQSSNEVAQWSGPGKGPPGNSAFRANGITAQVAVGTRGMDGDVWKVTN